jgi:hypothetical protein
VRTGCCFLLTKKENSMRILLNLLKKIPLSIIQHIITKVKSSLFYLFLLH